MSYQGQQQIRRSSQMYVVLAGRSSVFPAAQRNIV